MGLNKTMVFKAKPSISVIMPAYNAELYISASIESILKQDYKDFEYIIINDGSTDSTQNIINNYSRLDSRIVSSERENKGIVNTLNEAIAQSKGQWIARMDADDVAYPNRFSELLKCLIDTNSQVCGSWIELFGGAPKGIVTYPYSDEAIKFALLFGTAFAHPSTMIDTQLAKKNQYCCIYECAEDYELWTRLSLLGIRMANVQRPLIQYRVHKKQISSVFEKKQLIVTKEIKNNYWQSFDIKKTKSIRQLEYLILEDFKNDSDYLKNINSGFIDLIKIAKNDEAKKIIIKNWEILYIKFSAISTSIYKNWKTASLEFSVGHFYSGLVKLYFLRFFRIRESSYFFKKLQSVYLIVSRKIM